MSTYFSDQQMGDIRDEFGAEIDVADSSAEMRVRVLIMMGGPPGPSVDAEIEMTAEQAEKVAAAITRSVANLRTGSRLR